MEDEDDDGDDDNDEDATGDDEADEDDEDDEADEADEADDDDDEEEEDEDNTLDFGNFVVETDSIISKAVLEKCISEVLLQEAIEDRKRERECDFEVDESYYKKKFLATEMNSFSYYQSVYKHLLLLSQEATEVSLFSFRSRQSKIGNTRYLLPDVDYDAWAFACKASRAVFNEHEFTQCFPQATGVAFGMRLKLRICVNNGKDISEELWF